MQSGIRSESSVNMMNAIVFIRRRALSPSSLSTWCVHWTHKRHEASFTSTSIDMICVLTTCVDIIFIQRTSFFYLISQFQRELFNQSLNNLDSIDRFFMSISWICLEIKWQMDKEKGRKMKTYLENHIKTHLSLEWKHVSFVDQNCFIYLMSLKMDFMF